jgi:hypothetical protein
MALNGCKSEYEKRRKHEIIRDCCRLSELNVFPHNPEVVGSNPAPATTERLEIVKISSLFILHVYNLECR